MNHDRQQNLQDLLVFALLVAIGVAGRWGQPEWCFTPTAAAAIFAGLYFSRVAIAADGADRDSGDQRFVAAGVQQHPGDDRDVRRDDAARLAWPMQRGEAAALVGDCLEGRALRLCAGDAVLSSYRISPSGRFRATMRNRWPGWPNAIGPPCRSIAGCSPATSFILTVLLGCWLAAQVKFGKTSVRRQRVEMQQWFRYPAHR